MRQAVMLTQDSYEWLKAQCKEGESINALIRRMAGIANTDSRVKWPVLAMKPGDQVTVPWNRDKFGNAQLNGLNAAVARCNRMPGRKYRSFPTGAGLQIHRIE